MKKIILIGSLLLVVVMWAGAYAHRAGLIVHEWGTFTTVAGESGAALEWRPLASDNELPDFVYKLTARNDGAGLRHFNGKNSLEALVRMETPVLYFYADHDTAVSVKVDFPKGNITEWYPRARSLGGGIDWGKIMVMPDAKDTLPVEKKGNHYYAARDTDAALVRVCSERGIQFEKFLFYRGVANFILPVWVKLEGDTLRVGNLAGIKHVVVFENRTGKVGFAVQPVTGDELTIARPQPGRTVDELTGELKQILVSQGLFEKEANAMLATWRDSWFEDGLRVLYVLPRTQTDQILPLQLDPKPAGLVRVLVGRIEVITPELEADVLKDPAAHGRFAEPVLKQLLARTTDAGQRTNIEHLLKVQ